VEKLLSSYPDCNSAESEQVLYLSAELPFMRGWQRMDIEDYEVREDLIATFLQPNLVTYHIASLNTRFEANPVSMILIAAIMGDALAKKALLGFSSDAIASALLSLDQAQIVHKRAGLKPANELPSRWSDWGESAWFFHLATKDASYERTAEGQILIAEEVNEQEPPAQYVCYCDDSGRVQLPRASCTPSPSIWDVLLTRRTCRNFSDSHLSVSQLANLLYYTGGTLFDTQTDSFGRVRMKCAPSPGARHVTELYPVIRNVESLEHGIYHYCSQHHALALLEKLSLERLDAFLAEALNEQPYFANAPLTVFMSASLPRIMWKYRSGRVYRLIHFEIGHYAQNFLVAATALGLGAFVTGAIADSLVESAIHANGVDEIAMYAVGAGVQDQGGPYFREAWWPSPTLPDGAKVQFPGALSDLEDMNSE
jgi:SagB-type dehydrogenase family enzyme